MKDMAKLDSIEIRGFKSVSTDLPVRLDVGDITVMLGANGSGKSNIIAFFKMLNYMMSGSLQSFVAERGGSQAYLHYGSSRTKSINGRLSFTNGGVKNSYEFTLSYASPDNLIITSEMTEVDNGKTEEPSRWLHEVTFKESVLSAENDSKVLKIIHRILANCKVYQFHDSSDTSGMRNASNVGFDNYLQAEANNLAAFLYRIRRDYAADYSRIVSYVRMVVPQFKDFVLEPQGDRILLRWRDDSASDYLFMPNQFSDGSMRFIALATLLLQPRNIAPSVIIIDEPELGLHPYAISQLAAMIKEASKHSQVIVATQSPYLVNEFDAEQIVVVESTHVNHLDATTVNKLDKVALGGWLEEYSLSELWDKNIIGGRPE